MVKWKIPENSDKFVREVLALEADDIPLEKINEGRWIVDELSIDEIMVNEEMIQNHNKQKIHINRRDKFIDSINEGKEIYPLIVIGENLFLVDGYARYRALKQLGVDFVEVFRQEFR